MTRRAAVMALVLMFLAGAAGAQVVLPLLQGPGFIAPLTACTLNFGFDGSDVTGCQFYAVSAFR